MDNLTPIAVWAETLSITRQAGYAAVRRCRIPVVDGKVDPEEATRLYKLRTRYRVNAARMRQPLPAKKTLTVAELVELAEDIGQFMCDDAGQPHVFNEGLRHLLATLGALARLDEAAILRVRLPQRCSDAVQAFLESP